MSILKLIKWFLGKHYYINAVLPPMFPEYTKLAQIYAMELVINTSGTVDSRFFKGDSRCHILY